MFTEVQHSCFVLFLPIEMLHFSQCATTNKWLLCIYLLSIHRPAEKTPAEPLTYRSQDWSGLVKGDHQATRRSGGSALLLCRRHTLLRELGSSVGFVLATVTRATISHAKV